MRPAAADGQNLQGKDKKNKGTGKKVKKTKVAPTATVVSEAPAPVKDQTVMPVFHQKIKPRSCRRPLIVDSRWKNNKNGREYWVGTEVWD